MESKDPIQKVLDYIDENINEYLSVSKLSEIANCSTPHLFRLFVSDMDVTPIKYALRHRLYYAAKAIVSSDAKIIDIANAFGFESHDSFGRAFKRVYGVSPSMFRKEAYNLNQFYRDKVYCISSGSVSSLKKQAKDVVNMVNQKVHETVNDVDIVTMPEIKLIGVERVVGGGSYEAFYEAYDRVFRNAPNRKYPNSENATHGIPRLSPDGSQLLYFVGIEVTNLDNVPEGAVSYVIPEHLCAGIGFEGGIDYDELSGYFRDKWLKEQSKYKADPHKIDPRFSEDCIWEKYWPVWEYYTPNKNCDTYEEWLYLPVTPV